MKNSRYHLNPDTGQVNICHAFKRPCKFGEANHFSNMRSAERAYESLMNAKLEKPKRNMPPINVPKNKIAPVEYWRASNINRGVVYDGGDILSIDVNIVVAEYLGADEKDWPNSIKDCVRDNLVEWSDISTWSVADDMLSDDFIVPPNNFSEKLTKAYYDADNAIDSDGVLAHVRGKGFNTSGLTPLEALKKMLREENAKYVTSVENTTNISSKILSINDFTLSDNHLKAIEGSAPRPINNDDDVVLGVVRLDDRGYHLIDGHHRVKWCQENRLKSGKFFVVS